MVSNNHPSTPSSGETWRLAATSSRPLGGRFIRMLDDAGELLRRYRDKNFDTSNFATRLPEFSATTYRESISVLPGEMAQ